MPEVKYAVQKMSGFASRDKIRNTTGDWVGTGVADEIFQWRSFGIG
jgi:hypothetical protein